MKKKILAGLLLAGGTMFAAPRISFGISIGVPAPVVVAPPIVAAVPPCPGPGYVFVNGYWQLPAGRVVWQRVRSISRILTGTSIIFAANAEERRLPGRYARLPDSRFGARLIQLPCPG